MCFMLHYYVQKVKQQTYGFAGMLADSSPMIDGHQVHLDPKQQTGINFTIKSRDEAILLIEDEVEAVKFKVGIGASGNSVTWLSRIKGRKRTSGQKGMMFQYFYVASN